MPDTILANDRSVNHAPELLRRDFSNARRVYRAQIIRHAFGPGAARIFMKSLKFAPALIERVLSASDGKLRR
jgi:hypothetical protein